MSSYHIRSHPFVFGVAALILGPYILAFALLVGVGYLATAAVGTLAGKR